MPWTPMGAPPPDHRYRLALPRSPCRRLQTHVPDWDSEKVATLVRDHIFRTTRPIFTEFFVHVAYGRCSVLPWRRSDTLCTSGFMDDVIFFS